MASASFSGNIANYIVVGSLAMLAGRFGSLIPMLAVAGSMGPKWVATRALGKCQEQPGGIA